MVAEGESGEISKEVCDTHRNEVAKGERSPAKEVFVVEKYPDGRGAQSRDLPSAESVHGDKMADDLTGGNTVGEVTDAKIDVASGKSVDSVAGGESVEVVTRSVAVNEGKIADITGDCTADVSTDGHAGRDYVESGASGYDEEIHDKRRTDVKPGDNVNQDRSENTGENQYMIDASEGETKHSESTNAIACDTETCERGEADVTECKEAGEAVGEDVSDTAAAEGEDIPDAAMVSKKDLIKPREKPVIEDESLRVPIQLLPGESLRRLGLTASGGTMMLTNFRLFITYDKSFVNIPVKLIENASCKDVAGILVHCKDGTVQRCTLPNSASSFVWLSAIKQEASIVHSFADYFSVTFPITSREENDAPWHLRRENPFQLGLELRRLGFDLKHTWRISNINETYGCCRSYPKENVVPKEFTDEMLQKASPFRVSCRFPTVVWRNRDSKAVLMRCSQPSVGVFLTRSEEDECLIQEVIKTCGSSEKMLIADARSYAAAMGNRAKGGGFEYPDYYVNCEVAFFGLPNIHTVMSSFIAVRTLISSKDTTSSWYAGVSSTDWLANISLLISSSKRVAEALTTRPVLVHCSDGWDRTPQLCGLAQLISDPYYRTYKGFQVLIAKEWLRFGHKFAERCGQGHDSDIGQRCPVFLQWLDSVYQITCQFPTAFEFNEAYLMKLVHHTYSCMFGTFLFDCEKDREDQELNSETVDVWSLLDTLKPQLTNKLYTPSGHKMLDVSSHQSDLVLWTSVYAPQTSHAGLDISQDEVAGLQRSQSYGDISVSTESNLHLISRRLSDPDLLSSMNLGEDGNVNSPGCSGLSQAATAAVNESAGSNYSCSPIVKLSFGDRSRNDSGASSLESARRGAPSKQVSTDEKGEVNYSKYIDIDGLTISVDPARQRLVEIISSYERRVEELKQQIQALHNEATHTVPECDNCKGLPVNNERCDPGSAGGSCSDNSDNSWEDIKSTESSFTKWIPDHAAGFCSSCNARFRVFRRRHHCRQCGQVFCTDCAGTYARLPKQQLYEPVRVCLECYKGLSASRCEDKEPEDVPEPQVDEADDILVKALERLSISDASDKDANSSLDSNKENVPSPISKESKALTAANLPQSQPMAVKHKRRSESESWTHMSPYEPDMASSPTGGFHNISDLRHGSPSGRKTCSQESINNESGGDGKLMLGAKASC